MKKTNSYYFVLIALYFYNLVVLRVSSTFNEFGCKKLLHFSCIARNITKKINIMRHFFIKA